MADKKSSDYMEENSKLEPIIVDRICRPVLKTLPESVSPNTITVFNVFIAASAFIAMAIAPDLTPGDALVARIFAGFAVFVYMVTDCLDGMQARRTNRCSKLGQFLDHWVDAVGIPLCAAGFILTLELDPVTTVVAIITAIMVYNSQLVLDHHTGRFVQPPVSGVDATFMLSLSLPTIGAFLYIFPRETAWVGIGITAFTWICVAANLRNCRYYYVKMQKFMIGDHLKIVVLLLGFAVPYLAGFMSATAFCIVSSFICFRICGSYVLYNIIKRPYSGFDWATVVWIPVICIASLWIRPIDFHGYSLQQYLPYLACIHIVTMNGIELSRYYHLLKSAQTTAHTATDQP